MPEDRTIDDVILELQAMLRKRATSGITATLECDPPVVVGRVAVRVRARFFASAEVLATLGPVLRCEEVVDFDGRPLKARGREGEYVLRLPSGSVDNDTTYHLTLHPDSDARAIARYTLHTFSTRVVAAAERSLREVFGPERTRDAASRRRGRTTRRRT